LAVGQSHALNRQVLFDQVRFASTVIGQIKANSLQWPNALRRLVLRRRHLCWVQVHPALGFITQQAQTVHFLAVEVELSDALWHSSGIDTQPSFKPGFCMLPKCSPEISNQPLDQQHCPVLQPEIELINSSQKFSGFRLYLCFLYAPLWKCFISEIRKNHEDSSAMEFCQEAEKTANKRIKISSSVIEIRIFSVYTSF